MSTAINTIQAANNGLSSITKLVQSAQSLVSQAQQTTDTAVRKGLATQYDALLTQIGQLAGDAGLNGINLLAGDNLTVDAQREVGRLEVERHRQRRRLHQHDRRQRRAEHRQRGRQLGEHRQHQRSLDRADGGADHRCARNRSP